MKYAAISLHLDSLGEAYGFPQNYRDPTFFEISERFFRIADEYDFRYSIYVIGRDLEKTENRERVGEWSSQGHEIGNHSWSHPINIGVMSKSGIRGEVELSHKIIEETTGHKPDGFISPAWSTSPELIRVLMELGYSYDASSFPSWVIFPVMLKYMYNHIGSEKIFRILRRRDFLLNLFGPRGVYRSNGDLFGGDAKKGGGITVMPMPTNHLRVACWHTMAFVLGWGLHKKILDSCLRETDAFYYTVHPADLMDRNDLDPKRRIFLERLDTPLGKKTEILRKAIETILDSGRKIVTMRELAEKHRI